MIPACPSSTSSRLRPLAASLVLSWSLLLAACAGDAGDWKAAQDADTQEAYEAFLARHPDSEYAPQAKERTAQLLEERDWAAATRSDTPEAYQKFIGQHPDGKWTQEARIRVENFNVMAAAAPEVPAEPAEPAGTARPGATAAARAAGTAPGTTTPVLAATKPAPGSRPAPAPAPASAMREERAVAASAPASPKGAAEAPATGGAATAGAAGASPAPGYRVQLGAFSSVDKAEAEWARARDRFPALQSLEPRITPVQAQARRLFRLQAGMPDEAAAKGLCETLKGGGQPCLVVPVK
ncbi:MAG: SPOR domain-containing protein [Steroidobacteraceae bacterium]|jgi:hypothetical protein|nr:SPOR domain-containing protein [Steroidobacteraceae bacterium]